MNWLRRWWHRDRLERELDAELRFHVDRLVDDHVGEGMTRDEARRAAWRDFGGVEQVKEDCRDARATRWAHDVGQDLRFAARLLAKDRAFTALAVMALALGIGVNNAFLAIVNAMCLRGPLEHASRLVHVGTANAAGVPGGLSYAETRELPSAVPSFETMAAYRTAPVAVSDDTVAAERATAAYVSVTALEIAREAPAAGRTFESADHRPGAAAVALVGASLSQRRYGSAAGALGRTIRIDGRPAAVIGVMRKAFRFPNDAEIWLPLEAEEDARQPSGFLRNLGVFARLEAPATVAGAQAELGELSRRLAADRPRSNAEIRLTAVPFNERFTARITDPAWMAFITAGALVLLIACANVANLLLGRAVRRSAEMAMRASLGATRGRMVRQLLVECALLAAVGGAAGLLVSAVGLRLMSAAIPEDTLPSWMALTMDRRVIGMLAAACVAAVFVFGFVPALYTSAASVTHVLRDQSRVRAAAPTRRWMTAFLVLQFALTSILLTAVVANVLLRKPDEPNIDVSGVMTTWVTLSERTYATGSQRAAVYERLLAETMHIAGVSSTTVATSLPFERAPQRRVVVPGRQASPGEAASTVGTVAIGPRYFETFGVGILRGRDFNRDGGGDRGEAIVNQRFADLYFPNQDPLAQRIRLLGQMEADSTPALTIVGIAPNIRRGRGPDTPLVYRSISSDWPATATLILRHRADEAGIAAALRERVRNADPDVPLFRTMAMERVMRESTWNGRVSSGLVNTISTIALILAVVGLYGVTAHAVAARAREIGVRVALGAQPRHIRWLVLRHAVFQLALGLPAGAALTVAWNYVFIVQRGSRMVGLPILGLVAVVIAAIGIAACLVPAERAVRLDPLASIRHE